MDSFEEAGPGKMCQSARIVAVGLMRPQRLQCLRGLPALRRSPAAPAHRDRDTASAPCGPSRIRSADTPLPSPTPPRLPGGRCRSCLQNHAAVMVDNADMRLVHRYVQSSKILHGCSPLHIREPFVSDSGRIAPAGRDCTTLRPVFEASLSARPSLLPTVAAPRPSGARRSQAGL